MKINRNLIFVLVVIPVFFLMAACAGTDTADTPETQPTTTSSVVTVTAEPPSLEIDQPGGDLGLMEEEIATRTPMPTAAPGLIEEEVSHIVSEMGVDEQTFLGLGIDDWIILGIVPNSIISANEIINYTFPDPRYRIQIHVGIGYGTPITTVRSLITETVYQVDGVLDDKPVDALYHEMGDSAMIFRVRWWIDSYEDTRRVIDRVHAALQEALDAAEIDMPFPTQTTNFQIEPQMAAQLWQAWKEGDWVDRFPDDEEAPSSFQDE